MLKVLIADDEKTELDFLENYLLTHHEKNLELVAICNDGASALKEGLEKKPDIAFLDIQMPNVDGLEVARGLKENNPDIKIVIITAFGRFDYAKSAIGIGVSSYLVKPFQNEELDKVIFKLVGEKGIVPQIPQA
ncbi:MAG: response regulator, partial [Sphaerochaetaceae bacterium]|nr:response regulator [Sphaerochaetaceae bacterium]